MKRRMPTGLRPGVGLALVLSCWACGGEEPRPGDAGGGAGGTSGEAGVGGTGGGVAVPECALGFEEPDRPYVRPPPLDYEELNADPNRVNVISIQAPEEANSRGSVYWLTGTEPLCVEVEVGLFAQFPEDEGLLVISALVDGRQVPVVGSAGAVEVAHESIGKGAIEYRTICILPDSIPDGHHLVLVHAFFANDKWYPSNLLVPFVALRNSFCPPYLGSKQEGKVRPAAEVDRLGLFDRRTGQKLVPIFHEPLEFPGGRLEALLTLQREPPPYGGPEVLFVALVDGRQVPLGAYGPSLLAAVPEAPQLAEFELYFDALPGWGDRHAFHLVRVAAPDKWGEDAEGGRAEPAPYAAPVARFYFRAPLEPRGR